MAKIEPKWLFFGMTVKVVTLKLRYFEAIRGQGYFAGAGFVLWLFEFFILVHTKVCHLGLVLLKIVPLIIKKLKMSDEDELKRTLCPNIFLVIEI